MASTASIICMLPMHVATSQSHAESAQYMQYYPSIYITLSYSHVIRSISTGSLTASIHLTVI